MAFTRKNVAAAVAGTLSLAMLTGCPAQAPTGTSPSTPASAAPSAPTSAAPTTATSAAPSAQPSGTASGAPSAAPSVAVSAPPASGKTVIVGGTIYNEKGATVDGATVTVKSLDASVPYSATVSSVSGSYVVNNVPEGANVEVIVTKDGWTSRRRVQSFQQSATGQRNLLNFGGAEISGADNTGLAYFISDYPEIAMTTPEHDAKGQDPTALSFKVVFSEKLTDDSRDAFEDSFVIAAANLEAGGAATGEDLELDERTLASNNTANETQFSNSAAAANLDNQLQVGDSFMRQANKAKATWNSAGNEVTISFGGNLKTDKTKAAKYQAALLAVTEDIEDEKGNALGTSSIEKDDFGRGTNGYIYNAFKHPDLAGTTWWQTHKSAVSFEMKRDEVAPKLTGVAVNEQTDDLLIELTFSKPLAAYDGTTNGLVNSSIYTLSNYSFMVADKVSDLTGEDLEGDSTVKKLIPTRANGSATTTWGFFESNGTSPISPVAPDATATQPVETEFAFAAGTASAALGQGGDLETSANAGAAIVIEVDANTPNVVNLWLRDANDLFDDHNAIIARATGITDPAGNSIKPTDADNNLITASF
jgi:hypothetical protein